MQMKITQAYPLKGFALIDALVALIIVGIMTAGFSNAWLQFQRKTQLTQARQTVLALLDDLSQNLLVHDARFGTASRIALTTRPLTIGHALTALACSASACNATEFADATLQTWASALHHALPLATVVVTTQSGWQRWEVAWPTNPRLESAIAGGSADTTLTRVVMWL